ncbi:MAG: metallophosphoesterase [Microscillaceae bacterium]|nr:metallophosphoesterase [Microscillaceae bacterium]
MEAFRFVQLSDLHLHPDEHYSYQGYEPYESLLRILEDLQELDPQPDFLLLTGDVACDKQKEVYYKLDGLLKNLDLPYYWIGGNHDDPDLMNELIPMLTVQVEKAFFWKGIRFILLDSVAKNRQDDHGELSDKDLHFLEYEIRKAGENPVVIALHHHPIEMGHRWIDDLMLRRATSFFEIIDKYTQVKAVIFGHIHFEFETLRKDVSILSAPSTAYQFKMGPEFALDEQNTAGYRVFDFEADGSFKTFVRRVSESL